jgi:putative transposase
MPHTYTTMLKAYSYRLYPTERQKQHFAQAMGSVRYIYNKGLETKTKHYAETGKTLSYFDLANGMLMEEKQTNEWLQKPNAQSLQMALRNLDNAYTKFFRKEAGFPQFKKRSGHQSVQYPQAIKVHFDQNTVWVPKVGKVRAVFDRKFECKIKTCAVSKTPTSKFFISILVEDGTELPAKTPITAETTVGIDLGIKDFAIFSNKTRIANPKFLRKNLNRLKVLQRRASKKQKGSKNRAKANLKVAKLHEIISNQRKDFLQQLSTKLIRENQTIILETLNVAGMLKNHSLAGSIQDVSWSEFNRMLTYKADWYGRNIIKIGRFEPSSKLCSGCGWKNNDLTLKDRYWDCSECHAHHDRDLNAAANIKKFGLIQVAKLGNPNKKQIQAAIEKDSAKRRGRKTPSSGSERPAELAEMPASTLPVVRSGKQDRRSKKSSARKS